MQQFQSFSTRCCDGLTVNTELRSAVSGWTFAGCLVGWVDCSFSCMYNRYILKIDFKALSHANAYAEKLREAGLHCTQAGQLLSKRAVVCTGLLGCRGAHGRSQLG